MPSGLRLSCGEFAGHTKMTRGGGGSFNLNYLIRNRLKGELKRSWVKECFNVNTFNVI